MPTLILLLLALISAFPVWARDDSNTAYQIPLSNSAFTPNLQTFLGTEAANTFQEEGLANFVDNFSNGVSPTSCFSASSIGLTMFLGPCVAYNAGYRSTCGVSNNLGLGPSGTVPTSATPDCPGGNSITFPNTSTTWVAMDESTVGNNVGLPNFTRVTGTHYLVDSTDALTPTMPFDAQLLMYVTTASGSITGVADLRNFSPFTPPINGANVFVHSITGIGPNPYITAINYFGGGVLDPAAFGCHGNYTQDTVTLNNGSNVVTSTGANLWSPTDVGKVFRAEDTSTFRQVSYAAPTFPAITITGFVNSGQITISAAPTFSNGDTATAEWASSDDACLAAMRSYVGDMSTIRSLNVKFVKPVAVTAEWNLGPVSGVIEGSGSGTGGTAAGAPFIWFGTTPDVPMIYHQGYGLTIRNMAFIGASAYPPYAGVQLEQPVGGGSENNTSGNAVTDSSFDPQPALANTNLPMDFGGGIATTLTADASGTSIAITTGSNAVGPLGLILLVDTSAGATTGNEVARVSSSYVRGSSLTITLASGLVATHPAASTIVLIPQGPLSNGVVSGFPGTQADINHFVGNFITGTTACAQVGAQSADGTYFASNGCEYSMLGFVQYGGSGMTVDGTSFVSVGPTYVTFGNSTLHFDGDSHQNGPGGAFGPNQAFNASNAAGGCLKILMHGTSAGGTEAQLTGRSDTVDVSSCMNPGGDFIQAVGSGWAPRVDMQDTFMIDDANGTLPITAPMTVHAYANQVPDMRIDGYKPTVPRHVAFVWPGGATNEYCGHFSAHKIIHAAAAAMPDDLDRTLCGTNPMADITNRHDYQGLNDTIGVLNTVQGAGANPLTGGAKSVTGCQGTNTGTEYWYEVLWSVTDASGHTWWGPQPTTNIGLACSVPPTITHPFQVPAQQVPGYDTVHLFGNTCSITPPAHTCADPGGETELVNERVNSVGAYSPPVGISNALQDCGVDAGCPAYLGTALPTFQGTGALVVAGPQQYPNPIVTSIAGLPSPCSTPGAGSLWQGLTGFWVNNQTSPCSFAATPQATSSAPVTCPVRCWPDGSYHISN